MKISFAYCQTHSAVLTLSRVLSIFKSVAAEKRLHVDSTLKCIYWWGRSIPAGPGVSLYFINEGEGLRSKNLVLRWDVRSLNRRINIRTPTLASTTSIIKLQCCRLGSRVQLVLSNPKRLQPLSLCLGVRPTFYMFWPCKKNVISHFLSLCSLLPPSVCLSSLCLFCVSSPAARHTTVSLLTSLSLSWLSLVSSISTAQFLCYSPPPCPPTPTPLLPLAPPLRSGHG